MGKVALSKEEEHCVREVRDNGIGGGKMKNWVPKASSGEGEVTEMQAGLAWAERKDDKKSR